MGNALARLAVPAALLALLAWYRRRRLPPERPAKPTRPPPKPTRKGAEVFICLAPGRKVFYLCLHGCSRLLRGFSGGFELFDHVLDLFHPSVARNFAAKRPGTTSQDFEWTCDDGEDRLVHSDDVEIIERLRFKTRRAIIVDRNWMGNEETSRERASEAWTNAWKTVDFASKWGELRFSYVIYDAQACVAKAVKARNRGGKSGLRTAALLQESEETNGS